LIGCFYIVKKNEAEHCITIKEPADAECIFPILNYILVKPVGLELGPLSLVRINEELLERKVAAPV
jgi:hypothetical protein